MDEDFFRDIQQIEVKFNGGTGKLPIFYREARSFTAMLPANLFKLKRLLPDPRFTPVQALPGVGVIALTAFEYKDTDIGPYNEFSIGIVLNSPYYLAIHVYNLIRQYLARLYNVYVYHLPVTTEIALRAGVDFYNYPKFIADIEFGDLYDGVTCDLAREDERILSLSGKKVPVSNIGEMQFVCQLYQSRKLQQAEFKLNLIEGAINWGPSNVSVQFNRSHPIGWEISDAILSDQALAYMYMPKIQGILYGPEKYPLPLMRHALISTGLSPARKATKPAAKKKAGTGKKKTGKK